jgi:hypothetical protein
MEATCKTCGEVFNYEKNGIGRLRRYCDFCNTPKHSKDEQINIACERCGAVFLAGWKTRYCPACLHVVRCERAKHSRELAKQNGITIVVPESKQCGHCKRVKPASAFTPQLDRPNGLSGWCKTCRSAGKKTRRAAESPKPPKQNGYHCQVCGVALIAAQRHCCADVECKKEIARRQARGYDAAKEEPKERTCKECGVTFTPEYANKHRSFCSAKCLSRNARRLRLSYIGEAVGPNPFFILERDGWRCYLCGVETPRELRGTLDPCAPETDHVIPLSRGGAHTEENLRCCCKRCNARKGNKIVISV